MKTRLDWLSPLNRLANEPNRHSFETIRQVLAVAQSFVVRWADFAELAGMRPVHLLRNGNDEFAGLAWRYRLRGVIEPICFPRKGFVALTCGEFSFVYGFEPDGRTRFVTGPERREIMEGAIEL